MYDVVSCPRSSTYRRDTVLFPQCFLNWGPLSQGTISTLTYLTTKIGSALVPSFLSQSSDPKEHEEQHEISLTYLDGLRGTAAVLIFICHFAVPFFPNIRYGYGYHDNNSFLQLPIIRLLWSGTPMVPIFFVISGVVLSLRPLLHMHNRDWSSAVRVAASTLFRRGFRLYLPTILSTFAVMLAARCNLFRRTFPGAVGGFATRQPVRRRTFFAQMIDWADFVFNHMMNPWVWDGLSPPSSYGSHLWTIPYEFRSSMLMFVVLIGLSRTGFVVGIATAMALVLYCLYWSKQDVGLFLAGVGVARLHVWLGYARVRRSSRTDPSSSFNCLGQMTWIVIFTLGLYLASYPDLNGRQTPGYLSSSIPSSITADHIQSAGAVFMVGSLILSSPIQAVFKLPLLQYFGRISFAMYILHEPLLQVFGWKMESRAFQITGVADLKGQLGGLFLSWPAVTMVLIWASDVFRRLVDVPSVRFAKWVERLCFVSEGTDEGVLPRGTYASEQP